MTINHFMLKFYDISTLYLSNITIWVPRIPHMAKQVENKTDGLVNNIYSFIDGTVRKICRPKYHQKQCYSGHKRTDGIKYQSIYSPEGFYMNLYGPVAARRHDAYLLRESQLMQQLKNIFPANVEGAVQQHDNYCIYGDPAYPDSQWIMGGFVSPANEYEKMFNTEMSTVRMVVEWGFKEVVNQFRFLDFKSQQKIYLSPIGAYYVVGIFFKYSFMFLWKSNISIF